MADCDEKACAHPKRSLQIGITAYECIPGLVFVRVPNERGRWMLTDRCVAEVDCGNCGALSGEPCFTMSYGEKRYTVGTHTARRIVRDHRHPHNAALPKPKLRVRAQDLQDAATPVADEDALEQRAPLVLPRRHGGHVLVGDIMIATDLQYQYVLGLCQSGTVKADKKRNVWFINEASFRAWWEGRHGLR